MDRNLIWLVRNFSFAVPSFVLMSIYLSAKRVNKDESQWHFLRRRAVRLMPAFLVWTAIYAIARWADGGIEAPSLVGCIEFFFFGSVALHLYFIPMIFYYTIAIVALPATTGLRVPICLIGLFGAILLRYADIPAIHWGTPETDAFPFYFLYNLPYLFMGILLFDLIERSSVSQHFTNRVGLVSLACGMGTLVLWAGPYFYPRFLPLQNIGRDTLLFLTFLFWPVGVPRWGISIAAGSFGVYLSHHLWVEGFLRLEAYMGLVSGTTGVTFLRFFVCLIVAMSFSFLLGKDKRLAWLVK